jgi:hypothetical protein
MTHKPHFIHNSTLITLDGVEFFADSAALHFEDERVGQMLCGFALDAGRAQANGFFDGHYANMYGLTSQEVLGYEPVVCGVTGSPGPWDNE